MLRELVARGHRVTCFAACGKQAEMDEARRLFPSIQYDLRLYPFPPRRGFRSKLQTLARPYSYMFSPELTRDLELELARGYDILHLEQLWCTWLALRHRDRALVNLHHLTWIDQEYLRPKTVRGRFERKLMFHAEEKLIRRFRHFRTCSPRLVSEILRVNSTADCTTIPVGIDAMQYDYIPDNHRTRAPVISVIGSMGWYPTSSAAHRLMTRLWPDIKRRIPGAKVQLVGWSAKSVLQEFAGAPDVEIAENVPDIRPYFERTGVMLYAPGRGSGMKIKILEAFAFGVPVVTTSEGVEGIPAIDGLHAGISEDDAGLIDRTVELLQNQALQNRRRSAARALLEAHCGPQPTIEALESLYERMLGASTGVNPDIYDASAQVR
ncbi:MAG: glycosyltransferase [Planctomycetales bacterium]|nr:glycosyltransferase [Planctomycetales bacterium]